MRRRLAYPRFWTVISAIALGTLAACGMGSEPQGMATNGVPTCEVSLLHPAITVAATSVLPGQLIVYVDGVMACIDNAAKVDQLLGQMSAREAQPVAQQAPAAQPVADLPK